ncbi:MAG TPA: Qat anti-phage system associated protein QatB [Terriglobales bacterium]|nr:Qat anti-phage system associated protein QatB [Terriglobales bacterium]
MPPDGAPATPVLPPDKAGGSGPADGGNGDGQQGPGQNQLAPQQAPPIAVPRASPIAPVGRFGAARRWLTRFAGGGDAHDMRRGVRHYVRSGYGGGGSAVRRFGGTASTANVLYGALSSVAGGQAPTAGSSLDPVLLAGRSAREIMDAIVEAVRPADGTQDAEAGRVSIKDALAELLTMFPDADLLNLSEDQRTFVIERFVAIDVFRRFYLDLGKTIQDKAPTATAAMARLKEVKNYIKETIAAAFRKLRAAGSRLTTSRVTEFVRDAIREAFQVFEGYIQ